MKPAPRLLPPPECRKRLRAKLHDVEELKHAEEQLSAAFRNARGACIVSLTSVSLKPTSVSASSPASSEELMDQPVTCSFPLERQPYEQFQSAMRESAAVLGSASRQDQRRRR
jgi:hypothetical protein